MIRIRLSGIALYKKSTRSVAPLSLPHRGRGTAERRSGAFVNRRLETLLPALFHAACALSAPSGHLPLEGKADDTGIPSSKMQRSCHHHFSFLISNFSLAQPPSREHIHIKRHKEYTEDKRDAVDRRRVLRIRPDGGREDRHIRHRRHPRLHEKDLG